MARGSRSIVLAEDKPQLGQRSQRVLAEAGYTVRRAVNGRHALLALHDPVTLTL